MPSQVPMELPLSLPPGQGGFDDCWETLTPEEDKKEATECDAHSSQEEAFWGPALHAEPGAHGVAPEPTARAAASSDNPLETVTPEEDKKKLTMALGRPVVVLREHASAVSYHTYSVSEVHEQQPCVIVFFSEMKLVCMAEINRLR